MIESVNHRPSTYEETVPGISMGKCHRCGAEVAPYYRDAAGRLYCCECLDFGIIREDTILYRSQRPMEGIRHTLCPTFPLSAAQSKASRFVGECRRTRKTGFLHAVCGAGKTEILYEALWEGLNEGGRICLAIPRKDIVMELALRLRTVFPGTVIKALYEGSKDDSEAHLVVSTIHQLIRYHHEFDWIVLDEADAFPYRDDPLLHRLLHKALKPEGSLFLMSATINPEMAKAIHAGEICFHTLPARFHGQSLDLPKCIRVSDLTEAVQNEGRIPKELVGWFSSHVQRSRQALVFVPSVRYGERLGLLMNENGFETGILSSKTPRGSDIIARFRAKEWLFLVTTTILERGVTFCDIDVAVFSAEHAVFDLDTLVQIAGRVGRNPQFPHGEIVFFSEEKTKSMIQSLAYIRKMNHLGRKSGLMRDGM